MPNASHIRLAALAALTALTAALSACDDGTQPPTVAKVQITSPSASLTVGDTVRLTAHAYTAAGVEVPGRPVLWSSSDTSVLRLEGALVTALAPGSASVTAAVDGKSATTGFAVASAPVASVETMPASLTLVEGASQVVSAVARDAAGRPVTGRSATWRSVSPAVAEVDASGRVTAVQQGSATIVVEVDGLSANVNVTVVPVPVASVAISPTAIVLEVGSSRQLTATAYDGAGSIVTGRQVIWTVDSPAVVSISASGLLTGTGHGYATITATVDGVSSSVAATVTNGEVDAMSHDLIYHRTTPAAVGEIMILPTTAFGRPVKLNAGNVSRHPAPSPDGSRIAFYVSMDELGTGKKIEDIFAVDRNGMNMKQLTNEPGYDDQPSWSPAGDRIAYRRLDPATGRTAIWIMNADGSGKQNLTPELGATHMVESPVWSPDGRRIAFRAMEVPGGILGRSGIWSMAADGSDRREHVGSVGGFDQNPTWSPDGERIAFVRVYDEETDITIVTLATGATERLQLPGRQWGPAWSQDGGHIAYWQPIDTAGATAIYTVRADGTNVRLHTVDPTWGGGYSPQWIRR
jgi:uncharacterized protein YjdB